MTAAIFNIDALAKNLLPVKGKHPYEQKELTLLAMAIYGEARNQDIIGKIAVASVIINRWKAKYKRCNSVREQVLFPKQFSCFNPYDKNYPAVCNAGHKDDRDFSVWTECLRVAFDVYSGFEPDPTGGAIYYLTTKCYKEDPPKWDWEKLKTTITLGAHIFFKEI